MIIGHIFSVFHMSTNFLSFAGYSNDKYRASWLCEFPLKDLIFVWQAVKKGFSFKSCIYSLWLYFGFEQFPSPMTFSFPYGVILTPKARPFCFLNALDVWWSVSTLAGLELQLANFWCFNLSQSLSRWSLVRFPKTCDE